jgi:hypothetical protein
MIGTMDVDPPLSAGLDADGRRPLLQTSEEGSDRNDTVERAADDPQFSS